MKPQQINFGQNKDLELQLEEEKVEKALDNLTIPADLKRLTTPDLEA